MSDLFVLDSFYIFVRILYLNIDLKYKIRHFIILILSNLKNVFTHVNEKIQFVLNI